MIRPAIESVSDPDAPGDGLRWSRLPRRLHRLGLIAAHHKWVVLLTWLIVLVLLGTLYHAAGSNTNNNLDLPGTDSQAATDLLEQQFQAHVNPWCRPFATCIVHAREACRCGLETGDFVYVGYAVASEAWAALAANRDLDRFVREYTPALAMLDKVKMADFRAAHEIVLSWTLALQGRTTSRTSITHDGFDERAFVQRYERTSPFFLTFL
jgi:hypothetical protein